MSRNTTKEEGKMRTPNGMPRTLVSMLIVGAMAFALAACGGGGTTSSTSPGVAGPATVHVSIASAPVYPAGTTFAPSSTALSPATSAPPGNSPTFDNVFVTVTKLALIPSTGPEYPDADGELEMENSSAGEGKLVTGTLAPPIRIDLRHLSGDNVATLLNTFDNVPAGEYSKIRVYYDNVVGHKDGITPDTVFHPTAHYHFDVHFVAGNLVIPVASEPQGGIGFYSVVIKLVGLKYHQAGQSSNILLRPQIFAEVVEAPKYKVSGFAQNVNPTDNTFDIHTPGGTIVPAAYGATKDWIYIDNTIAPARRSSAAGDILGASGLDNGAHVDVIGTFSSGKVLLAEEVDITLPKARRNEKVYLGWSDNTIILRFAGDNVVFLPGGRRDAAFYDNAADPNYPSLTGAAIDTAIADNVVITARGYDVLGGIKAYWISVGP